MRSRSRRRLSGPSRRPAVLSPPVISLADTVDQTCLPTHFLWWSRKRDQTTAEKHLQSAPKEIPAEAAALSGIERCRPRPAAWSCCTSSMWRYSATRSVMGRPARQGAPVDEVPGNRATQLDRRGEPFVVHTHPKRGSRSERDITSFPLNPWRLGRIRMVR